MPLRVPLVILLALSAVTAAPLSASPPQLPVTPPKQAVLDWPHFDPHLGYTVKTFHLKAKLISVGSDGSEGRAEIMVFQFLGSNLPANFFRVRSPNSPVLYPPGPLGPSKLTLSFYLLTIDADRVDEVPVYPQSQSSPFGQPETPFAGQNGPAAKKETYLDGTLRQVEPVAPPVEYLVEQAEAAAAAAYVRALPPPSGPAPPPKPVRGIMPTIVYQTPPSPSDKPRITEFSQAMDALGAQVTPELARSLARRERMDADAELTLIAWDRRQHPQMYQELEQRYRVPLEVLGYRPALTLPLLLPEHATEKYRRVWEYLLLSPLTSANTTAANALSRIGNDASLPIYKLAYAMTADPKINAVGAETIQHLFLSSMSGFHDQRALLIMLACMALSQQQMLHQSEVWNPADYVRGLLAPPDQPTERGRWRPILLTELHLNPPPEQKTFLNTVLKPVTQP